MNEQKIIPKKKKSKKKTVCVILLWVLISLALLCIAYMIICSLVNRVAFVFGYGIIRIQSGSMEPAIMVNDYILVKKVKNTEGLTEGDVITFYSEELNGALNTHRIIEIEGNGEGFVTKGDNNNTRDNSPTDAENVVSVYIKRLPVLTKVTGFLRKGIVFFMLIMVPALALLSWSIVDIAKKKKAIEKKKYADAYEAILREETMKLGIGTKVVTNADVKEESIKEVDSIVNTEKETPES